MNKSITPYPKNFNLSDTSNVNVFGDRWRHVHINVTSKQGHTFRLKDDALLPILKGELKTLKVKHAYNLFYLVLPTEEIPKVKLKNGEISCNVCNEFGFVDTGICPACKGKKKLDWLEQVFIKEKKVK